eukprot:357274-Chlamydomonas_euryale.AAC.21
MDKYEAEKFSRHDPIPQSDLSRGRARVMTSFCSFARSDLRCAGVHTSANQMLWGWWRHIATVKAVVVAAVLTSSNL